MSVAVVWEDEQKSVVRYVFVDPWAWDQFYAGWDQVKAVLDASPHKISAILDLTEMRAIPPNSLMHMRALIQQRHPNFSELLIVVGSGKFGATYGALAQQLAAAIRYRLIFTDTLEEARRLLDDWNQQNSKGSPA
ncbi:MAG TPA: hypothetical protein VHD90_01395 [Phototrophicaceae bacterium]|nr:hypothetical protein [Phototrophicaceae bacterium]